MVSASTPVEPNLCGSRLWNALITPTLRPAWPPGRVVPGSRGCAPRGQRAGRPVGLWDYSRRRLEEVNVSIDRGKLQRLAREAAESEQRMKAFWEQSFAEARAKQEREDEAWLPDPAVIHRLAEQAATQKQSHAFVKGLSGLELGFREGDFRSVFGAPSKISPSKLSRRDRKLFDCCVREGYQVSIEVDRLPDGRKTGWNTGGADPSSWHFNIVVRW